ncbi:MAG: hypothetical protein AAF220_06850 [Pseudomonadota bacterium]
MRVSRAVISHGQTQTTVYGRFLTSTLQVCAALAEYGERLSCDPTRDATIPNRVREIWENISQEGPKLGTDHGKHQNWSAVFINGILVFGDSCPSEIVFIESVSRGSQFTAPLLRDVEAQYKRLGHNTHLQLVTEKALDLQQIDTAVECCVVTRNANGYKPIKFIFNQADLVENVVAALRTSTKIIEASVNPGQQLRRDKVATNTSSSQAALFHRERQRGNHSYIRPTEPSVRVSTPRTAKPKEAEIHNLSFCF